MTQTPDTEKMTREKRAGENGPRPTMSYRAADRLGLSGAEGARRRGALLRRLLAMGDWAALLVSLCATRRRGARLRSEPPKHRDLRRTRALLQKCG